MSPGVFFLCGFSQFHIFLKNGVRHFSEIILNTPTERDNVSVTLQALHICIRAFLNELPYVWISKLIKSHLPSHGRLLSVKDKHKK